MLIHRDTKLPPHIYPSTAIPKWSRPSYTILDPISGQPSNALISESLPCAALISSHQHLNHWLLHFSLHQALTGSPFSPQLQISNIFLHLLRSTQDNICKEPSVVLITNSSGAAESWSSSTNTNQNTTIFSRCLNGADLLQGY